MLCGGCWRWVCGVLVYGVCVGVRESVGLVIGWCGVVIGLECGRGVGLGRVGARGIIEVEATWWVGRL